MTKQQTTSIPDSVYTGIECGVAITLAADGVNVQIVKPEPCIGRGVILFGEVIAESPNLANLGVALQWLRRELRRRPAERESMQRHPAGHSVTAVNARRGQRAAAPRPGGVR